MAGADVGTEVPNQKEVGTLLQHLMSHLKICIFLIFD